MPQPLHGGGIKITLFIIAKIEAKCSFSLASTINISMNGQIS
jgi:hypothetical protein